MKVHVRKEFRPYTIEVSSSRDHQDLLRVIAEALSKYSSISIGATELRDLQRTLINTQGDRNESKQ